MAKTRKFKAAYFSKWRAVYWIIITTLYLLLIIYDLYRNNNFFLGEFDKNDWSTPFAIWAYFFASQWNAHLFRVIRTKNPHIRIEGDKIIAFGKVFPKGPNDYILFEKRGGSKLGYWATLSNGNDKMVIPLIPKRRYEEYVEPEISSIIT